MNENVQSYVAVVTVHGVGDQVPHRTTQEVTDLLLGVKRKVDGTHPQYTPFEEENVRVATARVDPGDDRTDDPGHHFVRGLLDGYLKDNKPGEPFETVRFTGARLDSGASPKPEKGVHIYEMYWADLTGLGTGIFRVFEEFFQLLFHMGDVGRQTAQIALESQLINKKQADAQVAAKSVTPGALTAVETKPEVGGKPSCRVEKPATFIKRWRDNPAGAGWELVCGVQKCAVWFLICPIAILNLYELAVALLVLIGHLNTRLVLFEQSVDLTRAVQPLALVALGIIVASFVGCGIFRLSGWLKPPWWLKVPWILFPLVSAIVVVWLVAHVIPAEPEQTCYFRLLACAWCVLMIWLLRRLLRLYAQHRKRVGWVAFWTGLFVLACFLCGVSIGERSIDGCGEPCHMPIEQGRLQVFIGEKSVDGFGVFTGGRKGVGGIIHAGVRTIELLFFGVFWCWVALLCLIWVQFCLLALLWWRHGRSSQVRRAAETILLLLITPTALFRVLTLAFWGVFWFWSTELVPEGDFAPLLPSLPPFSHLAGSVTAHGFTTRSFVTGLLNASATSFFSLMLIVLALALVLTVWALFPVVWADLRNPFFDTTDPAHARDPGRSARLGQWLNCGYSLLWFAGLCVFVAVPGFFTLGLLPIIFPFSLSLGEIAPFLQDPRFLGGLSVVLSTVTVSLLAFRGPLENLALGFRAAVRVSLDVDNYLREFPTDATPRAKIFARYASLLRFLCKWKDSQGRGYKAIVIIAHSQGTVITADLLRFLKIQGEDDLVNDTDLARPIYLLTAGSPLRQLYGWRFPHLYAWAYHDKGVLTDKNIPKDRAPDPQQLLHVKVWVNVYRSGDYVGRYLWGPLKDDLLWKPGELCLDGKTRAEICISSGSHNHYFDEDGASVGQLLDEIIGHA